MNQPAPPAGSPAGLTSTQAAARLARDGYNELPTTKPRGLMAIAASLVAEPMLLLLLACGAIYLLLGDAGEAVMLLGFVVVIIAITLVQERKAEHALEALRELSSPRALVLRDGAWLRIAGREVVEGDTLMVAEGDRIAADCVLTAGATLTVDESLLTGESVPVAKLPAPDAGPNTAPAMQPPGGDGSPFLYSGSLVVQGKGAALVLATGPRTALGGIGRALASVAPEPTHVQVETARLVKWMAWAGAALSGLVALLYGLHNGDWLNALLQGITLAMAILPEEMPVILTLFFALGAWRMSRLRVLTRQMPALEMLGSATVLCVDKTGTITQNRMTLAQLHADGQTFSLEPSTGGAIPEAYHELLEFSMLASHRDPFDPMEQAIKSATAAHLAGTEHVHADWKLIEDYPLSPDLLAMSRVWQSPDASSYVIAAKGAPEAIFDLCHLDAARCAELASATGTLAGQGLRVLGVARATFGSATLPALQHDFEFKFVGLIGLADPVRATVPAAVAQCHAAGIRVIMITGDYPATAANIARQAGLQAPDKQLTGAQLAQLSDVELRQQLREVNVFCRAVPEDKLRIVNALKESGEVVAMTGDGVNDAPALKASHIGIAMGGRGTDVAREAASLVLLDDDFSSIVTAVRFGRRIFDNLRKAFVFVIAVHIPIVGLSLLPALLGWPVLLLPMHIVFLELIIDPACSIAFEAEPESDDAMRQPPRPPGTSLLDRRTALFGALQGGVVLAVLLVVHSLALQQGAGESEVRALCFAVLVLGSIGLILSNRSRSASLLSELKTRNPALWWIAGGALVLLVLVLTVPALRTLFKFAALSAIQAGWVLAAGALCLAGCELLKRLPHFRQSGAHGRA